MSSKWFNAIHLLVCPLTVLVGYLMNAYGYGAALQATLNKDGLVNAMLVKKGWFWTSLVGWWCIIRYRAVPGATGRDRRHIVQSFKRYAILTVWWYVFTKYMVWRRPHHGLGIRIYGMALVTMTSSMMQDT